MIAAATIVIATGCKKNEPPAPAQPSPTPSPTPAATAVATVPSPQAKAPLPDACTLITKEEIQAVQGAPIKDTKSSGQATGEFAVSQCFYTATEYTKSVSLALTLRNPNGAGTRGPRDFWKETFGKFEGDGAKADKGGNKDRAGKEGAEKEGAESRGRGGEREEEKEGKPPTKVESVGEAAFWTGSRFTGVLYVLKGDAFIRISIGGSDTDEVRLQKSKALAEKAVSRL
jgi:hypothetical protein